MIGVLGDMRNIVLREFEEFTNQKVLQPRTAVLHAKPTDQLQPVAPIVMPGKEVTATSATEVLEQRTVPSKRGYNSVELRRLADGRWDEILLAAGIPLASLTANGGAPCPRCGGTDRFAPLSGWRGRGAVHCRHCFNGLTHSGRRDGLATLRWLLGLDLFEVLKWLDNFLQEHPVAAPPHPCVRLAPDPIRGRQLVSGGESLLYEYAERLASPSG